MWAEQAWGTPAPIWTSCSHISQISGGFLSKFCHDVIMIVQPRSKAVVHPSSSEGKGTLGCLLRSGVIATCWQITKVKVTCNAEPAQFHFVFLIKDVARSVASNKNNAVGLSRDGLSCSGAVLFRSP